MPVTLLLVPPYSKCNLHFYTSFHPIQTKGADYACDNTTSGEHITDIYITETGTTELENLSHNLIDIFITET